ncbi:MAG: TetR/AcrR family transcriptional regulator [Deltaproteobacteria bacterium]|nr:TetR/AcrR family transcriptional regulator [Deltaproteobacteria bacterium]MCB9788586.1 TetR/AcrR family transcriptional regulator [Deltaproteobacteria bacterium]
MSDAEAPPGRTRKRRSTARRSASRLPPEARRTQLLAVASELLEAGGVDALQMTELASAAGVTRPVAYRFFPNRRALILALMEDFELALEERFLKASGRLLGGTVAEAAALFVRAVCDTIEVKGAGAWNLLDSGGPDPEIARVGGEIQAKMLEPWRPHIQQATGASEREVETVARMLVAAGRAVLARWLDGTLSRDEAIRDATRGISGLLMAFSGGGPR